MAEQLTERITKALPCGKTITIDGTVRLTMREFRAWAKADDTGDYETAYACLARVIVAWDWLCDPRSPASYDDLLLHEYKQVAKAVGEWLNAASEAKN